VVVPPLLGGLPPVGTFSLVGGALAVAAAEGPPVGVPGRSESVTRGAVCVNGARTDLWEPQGVIPEATRPSILKIDVTPIPPSFSFFLGIAKEPAAMLVGPGASFERVTIFRVKLPSLSIERREPYRADVPANSPETQEKAQNAMRGHSSASPVTGCHKRFGGPKNSQPRPMPLLRNLRGFCDFPRRKVD
jgi:hypothetical protein